MKLKNLTISSFRGATNPLKVEFDPAKNITMIFGENGNGKTTISDALVSLCTDSCGSIDDKPSVDTSYLCAIGSTPLDVAIALETDVAKFKASLNVKPKATFSKFPKDGIPTLRFLRRKQIMDLLDLQPSQRYEKLQEYIDVSGVMASEDGLRKLVRTTKNDLVSETKSLTDSTNTLERIWEQENKPMGSWEAWAKTESEKDVTKETELHKKLTEAISHWDNVTRKLNVVKSARQDVASSEEKEAKLRGQLTDLETKGKAGNIKLLTVLESARNFISSHDTFDHCPVCKSKVIKDTLDSSLAAEIQSMKTLQTVARELEGASQSRERTRTILESALKEFSTLGLSFTDTVLEFVGKGSATEKLIQEAKTNADSGTLVEYCDTHLPALTNFMDRVKGKANAILNTIKQFNAIRENYRTITRVKDNAQSLHDLLHAGEEALKRVEYIRKSFIDESLNAVSADIERMYSQLHPGETLGGIRLFLHPTRKNSLEIVGSFYGEKDVTPQSLYSESHLDTLGICIFLALARKYNDNNTILVLDDVMMSVDEAHLDRLIELFHEISEEFTHLILTTHYRPWRDRYRNNRADASKVHFLELRPWSKERGITFQNGKIDVEELRRLISDPYFDRQKLASTSGIVLENILDFITYKFGSRLPRKPRNDYTLRELLDCLSKRLLPAMKVEHLEKDASGKFSKTEVAKQQEIKPLIDKIKDLSFVRNQTGAHFNLDGAFVSDKEVKDFAEHSLELADLLICPVLGSMPDRKPSGSYWETKSGSIRLYPLQEPS